MTDCGATRATRITSSSGCTGLRYVALAHGSPIGWLAWSGPIVMYVFLVKLGQRHPLH